jgi:hypothetical protein
MNAGSPSCWHIHVSSVSCWTDSGRLAQAVSSPVFTKLGSRRSKAIGVGFEEKYSAAGLLAGVVGAALMWVTSGFTGWTPGGFGALTGVSCAIRFSCAGDRSAAPSGIVAPVWEVVRIGKLAIGLGSVCASAVSSG